MIGNLPPNQTLQLEVQLNSLRPYLLFQLQFTQMLTATGKNLRFILSKALFPTSSSDNNVDWEKKLPADSKITTGFSAKVTMSMPSAIRSITWNEAISAKKEIEGNFNSRVEFNFFFSDTFATVTLSNPKELSKSDFLLYIDHCSLSKPRGWIEMEGGRPKSAIVCLWPYFDTSKYPRSEIIFLIDRSGSMKREGRMGQAMQGTQ